MGILLTTALVLAIASAIFEIRLFRSLPFLTRLVERFSVFGVVMSIFLSTILGMLFGAAGLIVLIAGMIATLLTQPYHSWTNYRAQKIEKANHINEQVQEFADTWRPVWKLIKLVIKIITIPLWGPVRLRRWWLNQTTPTVGVTTRPVT